ncbi:MULTISPECIES: type I restriction endonuclease subunit R [unclassified Haloferax]|uniref:type I restriction endonuclease subunit R n=1 Tax=unclassified Haloferax TaxID=2625095 RepID=UPI00287451F2|nr:MULTISPECIES: type I restriction endonuclease subunit R [unclassified Haloferax]MDS0243404.1 type I restriction endonuclease subunit R [Haloferax sp. S2CR25]MDS0446525.1 type I restriction endonuclease subunit R [Haloferax sp. S2CR25-2]
MADLPTEGGVERSILSWLDALGWDTHGLDGGNGAKALDEEYDRTSPEVVYWNLLAEQAIRLNRDIREDNVDRFLNSVKRDLDHDNLMDGNREFTEVLRKGKKFTVDQKHNGTKTIYADLIDFEQPENNVFHAVNQFQVSRVHTIRPDVTLFVNGIPLVQMELKSLAQDNDYYDAITDLHGYEAKVPRLFVPTLMNVAADTTELRYGAIGAAREFYMPWNDAPEQYRDANRMKQAVQALFNHETLLDLLKHFVFYERKAGKDVKIIPRYMQYYAVKRVLQRVAGGNHREGLIWHTQGSGKSFTMLYTAKNLLERDVMDAPQIFVVVDTDKLNSQMRDQLANLSFDRWTEAFTIDDLEEKIAAGKSELVVTTIQKFQDVDPDVQSNDEAVVMSDEAHRFLEKDLGSRLDAALPNAYHFGFTGTPVREGEREADRNTFREFSPEGEEYLHRYSIKAGIEDELILPVYFTLRHDMDWDVDEAGLDEEFDEAFARMSKDEKLEFIQDNVTSQMLAEIEPRVDCVVDEILDHFAGVDKNGWKGMVVTPSRTSAAMYGERLVASLGQSAVEVLYTARTGDDELVRQFHTESEERDKIVKAFKEDDEPKLLVVHNMLLTGFDAPILKTMYLDRNIKNHTLMQAIARTNRPAEGKENGEIVDFQGVFENIDDALDYDEETKAYAAQDRKELFEKLEKQLDVVLDIFDGIPRTNTQETIDQCLARVSTHPQKREFKQGFRRLQDLYESVSPDRRIVEEGLQEDYKWLVRVHTAFQRHNNRKDRPEDEMREKTKEIIEEHVNIDDIKRDYPVYEIGEEHLEAIEKMDNDAAKATNIAHATREFLQSRQGQNPHYKRLSERVTEIVEDWQQGNRGDPEAVEALKAVERSVLEVEQEAEERGMNDAEFAIYAELTEKQANSIESDEQAESIAREIVAEFEDRVDTGYGGWEANDRTVQTIELVLLDVLIKRYSIQDLVNDQFIDAVRMYLIKNYVE